MNETENGIKKETPEDKRIKLDQIIKLLFNVSHTTLVNTLNGLFNENFNPDDVNVKINKTSTEFVPDNLDIIRADSFFKLEANGKPYHYHIEYQLNSNDITIRVFEYAIQKALENRRVERSGKKKKRLYIPRSLVIHFEKSKSIPDKYELEIEFPDGYVHEYTIDVMKYWEYTEDKLINKKLYNLLPLQIFLLRAELDKVMKANDKQAQETAITGAKETINKIFTIINKLLDEEKINSEDYDKIISGLTEIMNHLDDKYNLELGGEIEMIKTVADKNILKRATKAEKAQEQAEQKLQQERIEIAKNFIDILSVEVIAERTKLSVEKVKTLKEEYLKTKK